MDPTEQILYEELNKTTAENYNGLNSKSNPTTPELLSLLMESPSTLKIIPPIGSEYPEEAVTPPLSESPHLKTPLLKNTLSS